MSSNLQGRLYNEIVVKDTEKKQRFNPGSRTYRGVSTVNPKNIHPVLYDLSLIKQDILNHFHIRQGEKLSDPTFGTILWDVLFEPFTDNLRDLIVRDVNRIFKNEMRVRLDSVAVSQYESGIMIDCTVMYLTYNIKEKLRLSFDENAGFLSL